jgi:hypothetical protein
MDISYDEFLYLYYIASDDVKSRVAEILEAYLSQLESQAAHSLSDCIYP